ncbi:energy transducer TonB [Hymenobacter sp. GOD-10R]|uniref:energy transducer TonB n=1 Tax=Hymenobacter sp. GOD-10R TaxID=3093922 RepID=UPI002D77E925|nr:energy transducer TonB [Hymenobacter sp. GOD-10R]WRQ28189.1 energy transducer TonB [Hymenobacter sp. GOD-10R]
MLLPFTIVAQTKQLGTSAKASSQKPVIYAWVQHMPTYPNGGKRGALLYLAKHVRLPEEVKAGRIDGLVFVEFVVNEIGKVQAPRIQKGLSPATNAEALRVIQSLPAWRPGRESGVPVAVSVILPVSFSREPYKLPKDVDDLFSIEVAP